MIELTTDQDRQLRFEYFITEVKLYCDEYYVEFIKYCKLEILELLSFFSKNFIKKNYIAFIYSEYPSIRESTVGVFIDYNGISYQSFRKNNGLPYCIGRSKKREWDNYYFKQFIQLTINDIKVNENNLFAAKNQELISLIQKYKETQQCQ